MNKQMTGPPSWALRFLGTICPAHLLEEIEGDLIQKYERDVKKLGEGKAKRRFIWNSVRFFRPGIIFRNHISLQLNYPFMLRNYLKVAYRNLLKAKGISAINITGLVMGITSAALMLLWVENEFSYDRFHHDGERLYEAWNREAASNGEFHSWSVTARVLAPTLKEEYPEVEEAVSYANWGMEFLFSKGDVKFTSQSGPVTESGFLSLFNFPLLEGNPKTALNDPHSIVLTKTFAEKLFRNEDALGKTISVKYGAEDYNFTVTGVMQDLPNNTGFKFDYLVSFELLSSMGNDDKYWGNNSVMTFVKLKPNNSLDDFNSKIKKIAITHSAGESKNEVFLYPVSQLRLYSKFVNGIQQGGRIEVVRLFEIIAFFIILISCINFMNLTTAKSEQRAKEVGIRKTVGAHRKSLIGQFLTESILIALVAGLISIITIQLALPFFNQLTEKQLNIHYNDLQYWAAILLLMLFVGLLAGSYPAFYLSSFQPIRVIKGNYVSNVSGVTIRRALVVFQFCFTIVLVIATIVVQEQIKFAQKRQTGYSKDNLIYHTISGEINKNYVAYKKELISSGVAVSISKTFSPITEQWSNTDGIEWQGKDPQTKILFDRYSADESIVETVGLQMIAGRDMDLEQFPSDSSAALINQSAAKVMGFSNPVGEHFNDNDKDWLIVGVFKDFVARSPYKPTEPMVVIGSKADWLNIIHIRLNDKLPLDQTLSKAEQIFMKYNPGFPFEYHFVDQQYEKKFSDEKKTETLSAVCGTLAIFISCLGVFGLSIHMAQKRMKEIGIRKVFGASAANVLILLSKEPVKLIVIAFIIASPIAYWAMGLWLENYDYKIAVGWRVFAITAFGSLLVALATISIQTIKSSLTKPVDCLKHE